MYVFAPPLSISPIPSETIHLLSLSLSLTHVPRKTQNNFNPNDIKNI